MAKEKQKPDNPVPENPLVTTPENPLISLLKEMQSGIIQINTNVLQLGKNDKILSDRMDNMEKNPPKKGIVEQVQQFADIAKSLGLDKVFGAIGESVMGGGEKEEAITTSQVPPEGYAEYVKFTKGMQNTVLDQAKQVVRKMTISNDQAEKDLGSDF